MMEILLSLPFVVNVCMETRLLSFVAVARLSSCRALALLIFSLNNLITTLYSSELPALFPNAITSLLLSSRQSSLFSQVGFLPYQLIFWFKGTAYSWNFKISFIKPSWNPLPFRTACQGSQSRSLNKPKVVVLLTTLLTFLKSIIKH